MFVHEYSLSFVNILHTMQNVQLFIIFCQLHFFLTIMNTSFEVAIHH